MKTDSTKLQKAGAVLVIATSIIGILMIAVALVTSGFHVEIGLIAILVMIIPVIYALGGYWMWKGSPKGILISIIITGLALLDIETENFSFALRTGLYLNIEFDNIAIDMWSAFILIVLILASIQRLRSNKSIESTEPLGRVSID
jgi:hypothetical protein